MRTLWRVVSGEVLSFDEDRSDCATRYLCRSESLDVLWKLFLEAENKQLCHSA